MSMFLDYRRHFFYALKSDWTTVSAFYILEIHLCILWCKTCQQFDSWHGGKTIDDINSMQYLPLFYSKLVLNVAQIM